MLRPLLAAALVGALTLPMSASSTPGLPELTAKVTVAIDLADDVGRASGSTGSNRTPTGSSSRI